MAKKRLFLDSVRENTIRQLWDSYIAAQTAKGVSDTTLRSYKQHLHSMAKYLDINTPIAGLQTTVRLVFACSSWYHMLR